MLKKRITQKELGNYLGIRQRQHSSWLSGKTGMSLDSLIRISSSTEWLRKRLQPVVIKDSLITTPHGVIQGKTQTNKVSFYNLDVIISVGYRVKSQRGTQFTRRRLYLDDFLTDHNDSETNLTINC